MWGHRWKLWRVFLCWRPASFMNQSINIYVMSNLFSPGLHEMIQNGATSYKCLKNRRLIAHNYFWLWNVSNILQDFHVTFYIFDASKKTSLQGFYFQKSTPNLKTVAMSLHVPPHILGKNDVSLGLFLNLFHSSTPAANGEESRAPLLPAVEDSFVNRSWSRICQCLCLYIASHLQGRACHVNKRWRIG